MSSGARPDYGVLDILIARWTLATPEDREAFVAYLREHGYRIDTESQANPEEAGDAEGSAPAVEAGSRPSRGGGTPATNRADGGANIVTRYQNIQTAEPPSPPEVRRSAGADAPPPASVPATYQPSVLKPAPSEDELEVPEFLRRTDGYGAVH